MSDCYNCAFSWVIRDDLLNDETVECLNKDCQHVWGRLHDIASWGECEHWKARTGRNVYEYIKPEALKKLHDEIFSADAIVNQPEETKEYLEKHFVETLMAWDVLLAICPKSDLDGFVKEDFKEETFEEL